MSEKISRPTAGDSYGGSSAPQAPNHDWRGSEDGHNCEGCPEDSIWRCDRMAHFDPKRIVIGLRPELDSMARQRRQAVDSSLGEPLMETLKQDEISRQYERDGAQG